MSANPTYIVGISAFYHDSAAAIIKDGEILAAAQEERFTRKKHDSGFPTNAVRFCLDYAGVSIDELKHVAFYDKPFLKFERLIETYYGFAPRGARSFLASMPVWLKEKLTMRKIIKDGLKEIMPYDKKQLSIVYPEHHLSHGASAYFTSPFEESAILTVDGVGEWATASICHGVGNEVKILKELKFPHSLGLLYSAFTYYLGFRVNSGEYKLMGLAPYGNPDGEDTKRYKKIIEEHLIDVKDDGSIWLNQKYFNYATGLRMVFDSKWEKLFGMKRREGESEIEQKHMDMALAIQQVTEEVVFKMADAARELTGSKNLCMAGGVALNCVANGKLLNRGTFENIYIQPAAGDAGGALGAALAAWHIVEGKEYAVGSRQVDTMKGSYLGPEYSGLDIESTARRNKANFTKYENFEELCVEVAKELDAGSAVGWFQGRMEWGPRALGNRSILGDARNREMQLKLNLKIKYRESFRPFAPSVLAEMQKEYFDIPAASPYMLLVGGVNEDRRKEVPADYHSKSLSEKLYFERSDLPAITHIDYSARVQSVHQETNIRYWKLINAFKELTGYGLVVNTSFNVRGEPIVCTPDDAFDCFMNTEMDVLVMGDYVFKKTEQSEELLNAPRRKAAMGMD